MAGRDPVTGRNRQLSETVRGSKTQARQRLNAMVASTARHEEVGADLVQETCKESSKAGCEWLHVDFEEAFAAFYMGAYGFEASPAGLLNPPRVCPEIVDSVT